MFELLEHAADLGFRARALSLPELFERAAEALMAIAMETANIEPRESFPLAVTGDSNESLLVNWLSEILYYLDGERVAMCGFRIEELGPCTVLGAATGEPLDPSRHAARLVVKGVTYHQLQIGRDEQGWFCEVFLDV